jgi:hypothetical protein
MPARGRPSMVAVTVLVLVAIVLLAYRLAS